MVNVHKWPHLYHGEAYDRTQWDDSVKDGDVIVCNDEHTIVILVKAWPTCAFGDDGDVFHGLKSGVSFSTLDGGKYAESYSKACQLAAKYGLVEST